MELYAAPLGDRGNARREAARKTREDEFDWSRRMILGRKDLWVVRLDREVLIAGLLRPEPEEFVNRGAAVCAIQPLAGCPPFELRGFRCLLQCFARTEQCSYVNSVVDLGGSRNAAGRTHWFSPVLCGPGAALSRLFSGVRPSLRLFADPSPKSFQVGFARPSGIVDFL